MRSQNRTKFLFLSLVFALAIASFPRVAQSYEVLLGTDAPGTFSYFSGRVLCRIINHQVENIQCRQVSTENGVYNLTELHDGAIDISLVDSQTLLDAINSTGPFRFLDIDYDNLRVLAPLYDIPATLVVRRDAEISVLDDLKGKRMNAGAPQSPQYLAVATIMQAKKWSQDDFSLFGDLPPSSSQDDIKAFCYGTMQAMVYVGIHPDFTLRRVLKSCNADFLNADDGDIRKMVGRNPALWMTTIAAGAYPTRTTPVKTFGRRAILTVSADLDVETVTEIVSALIENRQQLIDAHAALSRFSLDSMESDFFTGIARHPGVQQYLEAHRQ